MINNDQEAEIIFNRLQILKLVKPDVTIKQQQREILQGELDEIIQSLSKEWDEYNLHRQIPTNFKTEISRILLNFIISLQGKDNAEPVIKNFSQIIWELFNENR